MHLRGEWAPYLTWILNSAKIYNFKTRKEIGKSAGIRRLQRKSLLCELPLLFWSAFFLSLTHRATTTPRPRCVCVYVSVSAPNELTAAFVAELFTSVGSEERTRVSITMSSLRIRKKINIVFCRHFAPCTEQVVYHVPSGIYLRGSAACVDIACAHDNVTVFYSLEARENDNQSESNVYVVLVYVYIIL